MSESVSWTAYRPETLPSLSATRGGRGRIVALAATNGAISEGWTEDIALGLARSWSGIGADVLLIDAGLDTPRLHRLLHVENGGGLSDALLFGSSLASMTLPVEDHRFSFVPAGSLMADPADAVSRSRWGELSAELVEDGVTVLVFTPAPAPWAEALLRPATDIVVLALPSDVSPTHLVNDDRIRAVFGVGPAADPNESAADLPDPLLIDPLESMDEALPDRDDPLQDPLGDDWDLIDEQLREATPDVPLVSAANPVLSADGEPDQNPWTPLPYRRPRRGVVWVAAIALVGVIAAGTYAAMIGDGSVSAGAGAAPSAVVGPATPSVPSPGESDEGAPTITEVAGAGGNSEATGSPEPSTTNTEPSSRITAPAAPSDEQQRFAVAFAAFRNPAAGATLAAELSAAMPGVTFLVVPVEVNGTVFHRVIGGFAATMTEARALLATVAAGTGRSAADLVVRETPMAFAITTTIDQDEAQAAVTQLREDGLPAYWLLGRTGGGASEFRVFVGAFLDANEGQTIAALLRSGGREARLVALVGVPGTNR